MTIPTAIPQNLCDLFRRSLGDRNSRQPHLFIPNFPTLFTATPLAQFFQPPWQIIRSIFFDKTPDANWSVPWHQDLTICVQERIDTPGFNSWSIKEGLNHVIPPIEILEQILTIRIHLDDCGPENGPLRVIPRSHQQGRLTDEQIQTIRAASQEQICLLPECGALLMRPLLLHASSRATSPSHRRVLHLELTRSNLPNGLGWVSDTAYSTRLSRTTRSPDP